MFSREPVQVFSGFEKVSFPQGGLSLVLGPGMRGKNDTLTVWAMLLSCAVLVSIGWIAVRTIQLLREATERVVHTQEVLVRMERLKYDLKEVESAGRGYLLAARPELLTALEAGKTTVMRGVEELENLVRDNRRQIERLADLRPLITQRIELLAGQVETRKTEMLGEGELAEAIAEGVTSMGRVMSAIDALEQHELSLLRLRIGKAENRVSWVYAALVGGFILSLVLTTWPILGLRAEIREREKARLQLIASAERIQDLYNKAPCGYFSINSDGLVTTMNETLLHWLGLERSGLNRLTIDQLCVPELRADAPKALFKTPFMQYDVASDGLRFLVIRAAHPDLPPSPMVVVLGWSAELERRARGEAR